MDYIIENANILIEKTLSQYSILIKENKIVSKQASFNRYLFMKMNAEAFVMTPTFVLLDSKLPLKATFPELRKYIMDQFLLKGCTTLLTYANISYESELKEKVKELKTALISCPIDFIIGVKIPVSVLTSSFIRKCKKEKIPAIFLEFNHPDELQRIPWGWIREAIFPYNSPLIPIISNPIKKEAKSVMSKWKETMEKNNIPSLFEEIEEHSPLAIPILNKIGLYPHKASLMNGSELSYNLYINTLEVKNVEVKDLFHYHGDRLVVTVHKGKVIRAGKEVLFKPGYGEYVKVRTPSYFSFI
ncbi:hypothetical protein [Bacillus sp. MRMR6]|uniref:hypothetical protein n=1 Tax=Bacillus sp. MRMR6 TaxID=1928617 RepID=UPI0009517DC7|nr:hypothetical protein [Bacillus sp. MRMR6]OLS40244.1 hypothetical protein BTR25_10555 [Bacillus sp. MRMR6]